MAQLTALTSYVPNPFSGIITNPASCLSGPTVAQSQLLVPNPQFCGEDFVEPPWSNTNYNALQVRAEKRMSHGLQFLVNYTWSNLARRHFLQRGQRCWIGGFNRMEILNNFSKLPYGVSEFNMPQVLNLSYATICLSARRRMGPKLECGDQWVLGGWETTGIWFFTTGQPLPASWISCGSPFLLMVASSLNQIVSKLQRNTGSGWLIITLPTKPRHFRSPLRSPSERPLR